MLMYIAVKSQGSEETFIGTAVYSRCWQFCSENASISSFYIPRRVLIRTLGIGIAHVASSALVPSAWSVLGVDCRRHQFPPPQVTCWAYAKWCGRLPGAGRMDQTGERKCRWQPVNKIDQWDPWTWSKWGLVNDLNESSEGQSNQRTRGFHWSWMTGSAHWWTTHVNAILSGRYSNVNVTDMYYRLNVIGCSRCPSNTNLAGWRHDLCFCIVHLM